MRAFCSQIKLLIIMSLNLNKRMGNSDALIKF